LLLVHFGRQLLLLLPELQGCWRLQVQWVCQQVPCSHVLLSFYSALLPLLWVVLL
jgi:hypothetical protein